jgi:RNase P/RNase MRP subunit POP5
MSVAMPVEFSAEENAEFSKLASRLRLRAIFMLGAAGLQGLAAVLVLIKAGPTSEAIWGLVLQAVGAVVPAFVGVWSFDAARSFMTIVETEGRDRENLMVALDNMRRIVKLEYIVIAVMVTLGVGGVVLAMCVGAASRFAR